MPSYAKRQTKNGTVIDVRFRIINDTGVEVQKRLCGYPNKRAAEQAYMEFMKTYTPPVFKLSKDTKGVEKKSILCLKSPQTTLFTPNLTYFYLLFFIFVPQYVP